jgi:hypothetical protein
MSIAPGPAPTVSLSATTPRAPTAARAPTSEDAPLALSGGPAASLTLTIEGFEEGSDEAAALGWILARAFPKASELKGGREIVLAAVQNDWWRLEFAPKELKGDREIVLAAVQQYGDALRFASEELKADRSFMLAAVQIDGCVLRFASKELQADCEIVLAAVQKHGDALRYASEELKADPFVKALARRDVKFTCEYLKNLGRLRPTVASEFEALADKIVEIAKYFPELEQEAQDASAQVHNPRNDNGTYSCAHKRDRNEFETDFNCE